MLSVVYMLITHVRADELLGKKVYDSEGRLLGEVGGIASRRGRLCASVLRKQNGQIVRLPDSSRLKLEGLPRLRLVN